MLISYAAKNLSKLSEKVIWVRNDLLLHDKKLATDHQAIIEI